MTKMQKGRARRSNSNVLHQPAGKIKQKPNMRMQNPVQREEQKPTKRQRELRKLTDCWNVPLCMTEEESDQSVRRSKRNILGASKTKPSQSSQASPNDITPLNSVNKATTSTMQPPITVKKTIASTIQPLITVEKGTASTIQSLKPVKKTTTSHIQSLKTVEKPSTSTTQPKETMKRATASTIHPLKNPKKTTTSTIQPMKIMKKATVSKIQPSKTVEKPSTSTIQHLNSAKTSKIQPHSTEAKATASTIQSINRAKKAPTSKCQGAKTEPTSGTSISLRRRPHLVQTSTLPNPKGKVKWKDLRKMQVKRRRNSLEDKDRRKSLESLFQKRKRLRSELVDGELWMGLPFNLSMVRSPPKERNDGHKCFTPEMTKASVSSASGQPIEQPVEQSLKHPLEQSLEHPLVQSLKQPLEQPSVCAQTSNSQVTIESKDNDLVKCVETCITYTMKDAHIKLSTVTSREMAETFVSDDYLKLEKDNKISKIKEYVPQPGCSYITEEENHTQIKDKKLIIDTEELDQAELFNQTKVLNRTEVRDQPKVISQTEVLNQDTVTKTRVSKQIKVLNKTEVCNQDTVTKTRVSKQIKVLNKTEVCNQAEVSNQTEVLNEPEVINQTKELIQEGILIKVEDKAFTPEEKEETTDKESYLLTQDHVSLQSSEKHVHQGKARRIQQVKTSSICSKDSLNANAQMVMDDEESVEYNHGNPDTIVSRNIKFKGKARRMLPSKHILHKVEDTQISTFVGMSGHKSNKEVDTSQCKNITKKYHRVNVKKDINSSEVEPKSVGRPRRSNRFSLTLTSNVSAYLVRKAKRVSHENKPDHDCPIGSATGEEMSNPVCTSRNSITDDNALSLEMSLSPQRIVQNIPKDVSVDNVKIKDAHLTGKKERKSQSTSKCKLEMNNASILLSGAEDEIIETSDQTDKKTSKTIKSQINTGETQKSAKKSKTFICSKDKEGGMKLKIKFPFKKRFSDTSEEISDSDSKHLSEAATSDKSKEKDRCPKAGPSSGLCEPLKMTRKCRTASRRNNQNEDFIYSPLNGRESTEASPIDPKHKCPPEDNELNSNVDQSEEKHSFTPSKRELRYAQREQLAKTPKHFSKKKVNINVEGINNSRDQKTRFRADDCYLFNLENLPDTRGRRRKSDALELLKDVRLSKHACALWSSEQRRSFQLQHEEASSEQLDAKMRAAWEQLASKDALRYYQRAANAVKDRRQYSSAASNKRGAGQDPRSSSTVNRNAKTDPHDHFFKLPSNQQITVLHRKLIKLQRHLSTDQYERFLADFVICLKKTQDNQKKQLNTLPVDSRRNHLNSIGCHLLYTKLLDQECQANQHKCHVQYIKQKKLQRKFQDMITNLCSGHQLDCCNDIKSQILTDILQVINADAVNQCENDLNILPKAKNIDSTLPLLQNKEADENDTGEKVRTCGSCYSEKRTAEVPNDPLSPKATNINDFETNKIRPTNKNNLETNEIKPLSKKTILIKDEKEKECTEDCKMKSPTMIKKIKSNPQNPAQNTQELIDNDITKRHHLFDEIVTPLSGGGKHAECSTDATQDPNHLPDLSKEDHNAITHIENMLKFGSVTGATSMTIGKELVYVPKIVDDRLEMELLQQVGRRAELREMRTEDIQLILEICSEDTTLGSHLQVTESNTSSTEHNTTQKNARDALSLPIGGELNTSTSEDIEAKNATLNAEHSHLLQMAENAVYRMENGLETCCALDSPSCVMSTLVAVDIITRREQERVFNSILQQCHGVAQFPFDNIYN